MNPQLLIQALKSILKLKEITYKDLAEELDLSESSVKRIFSINSFTLERFCLVCDIAGVSLGDLNQIIKGKDPNEKFHIYSDEQEKAFVQDMQCLAFFDQLIQGSSPTQVAKKHDLSKKVLHTFLAKLDNLKLIEWRPNDRVKFLVSKDVRWQKGGLLSSRFSKLAREEFTQSNFDQSGDSLNFLSLQLSSNSSQELINKLSELANEYSRIALLEERLRLKRDNLGIMLAVRKWEFSKLKLK